jgi:DNA-binding response OmpR family regulator
MRRHASSLAAAPPSVLLIGPESGGRSVLQSILQKAGCRTFVCARCRDGIDLIRFASVVICEHSLPDGSWPDILRTAQALPRSPALIVTSRLADDKLWAEVLNLGGQDVLAQPFRAEEVMWIVRSAHRRYAACGKPHLEAPPFANGEQFGRLHLDERKQPAVCLFGQQSRDAG